ncbi:TPA: hypothetical protein DCY43_04295 [candidate division WWE3 bacterium]|uniref:Uncharacterized protein n=4 Tax=Katanobacteria TaxID=422282 RepID=A0A0G1NKX3_UNCKA|nr:MAG: hypothetical protein UW65_C0044G0003 [candidate division WWE3 bacterium GW2011_GWB1_44_4]KKT84859.1 MAG: hypothetical protein UW82_C0008G0006 [candidate division WWE3 bacterium GW2011_GWC2_44_9]OGC52098.1 MAG: hypothetical protein A2709_01990 [candidate division WWE3 bacterium RIFCSPHIGHO2_01_FULL_43_9]HAZ29925.1 hypothetical protein [candidate division WWE3 bacterium]
MKTGNVKLLVIIFATLLIALSFVIIFSFGQVVSSPANLPGVSQKKPAGSSPVVQEDAKDELDSFFDVKDSEDSFEDLVL